MACSTRLSKSYLRWPRRHGLSLHFKEAKRSRTAGEQNNADDNICNGTCGKLVKDVHVVSNRATCCVVQPLCQHTVIFCFTILPFCPAIPSVEPSTLELGC